MGLFRLMTEWEAEVKINSLLVVESGKKFIEIGKRPQPQPAMLTLV